MPGHNSKHSKRIGCAEPLREPQEAVLWERFQRGCVGDELMSLRADPRILVVIEAPHPDRHQGGIVRIDCVRVTAALGAEGLYPPAARIPLSDLVLAGRDGEGAGRAKRGHRPRRTGSALASRAVAVQ